MSKKPKQRKRGLKPNTHRGPITFEQHLEAEKRRIFTRERLRVLMPGVTVDDLLGRGNPRPL